MRTQLASQAPSLRTREKHITSQMPSFHWGCRRSSLGTHTPHVRGGNACPRRHEDRHIDDGHAADRRTVLTPGSPGRSRTAEKAALHLPAEPGPQARTPCGRLQGAETRPVPFPPRTVGAATPGRAPHGTGAAADPRQGPGTGPSAATRPLARALSRNAQRSRAVGRVGGRRRLTWGQE